MKWIWKSAAAGAATLLLAGCGQGAVARDSLQKEIAQQLATRTHQPAPKISCPKDLPGKVGASEQCLLTDPSSGGTRLPVAVRVDSVQGSKVHFQIQVATKPLS